MSAQYATVTTTPLALTWPFIFWLWSGGSRDTTSASPADINKFVGCMSEDHTHTKAANDLRKGNYTTGWIYCFH